VHNEKDFVTRMLDRVVDSFLTIFLFQELLIRMMILTNTAAFMAVLIVRPCMSK